MVVKGAPGVTQGRVSLPRSSHEGEARVMEGDDAWKERGGRGGLLERRLEIKPLTTLDDIGLWLVLLYWFTVLDDDIQQAMLLTRQTVLTPVSSWG